MENLIGSPIAEILFPVAKQPATDFGFEVGNTQQDHFIVRPTQILDGGVRTNPNFIASCSERYNLVPNADIFLPAIDLVERMGIGYEFTRIKNYRNCAFSAEMKLDLPQKVNGTDDVIFPRLHLTNSYDGSAKAAFIFGLYRLVCSNGIVIPCPNRNNYQIKLKHFDKLDGEITILQEKMEMFLGETKAINAAIDRMAQKEVVNGADAINEILSGAGIATERKHKKETKPSKVSEWAMAIFARESSQFGSNVWTAYNAANEALFSTNEKETIFLKFEKDAKLMDVALEMAN